MTTSSSPEPRGNGRPHGSFPDGPPRYAPSAGQQEPGYGGGPHGGPPPPQLKRLLTLTLVSAALYLLNGVVTAALSVTTDLGRMYEQIGLPAEQAEQADAMAGRMEGVVVLSTVVVLAVAMGIYALVHVFLRRGADWARILGIVLAVLSAVNVVSGLVVVPFLGGVYFGVWGIVQIVVGIALVVVNVLWVVTALQAPVRDWFTRRNALR